MKTIFVFFLSFLFSLTLNSQTQDGGYEYYDINVALNVDATIRCNYTYYQDIDGNTKWNTVALGIIYNNRDVDIRVDWNFYHRSIRGYQCASAASKFFTIKANSKKIVCTTSGFDPSRSSQTTFRNFDYKIKPQDMKLIVTVHGSFGYSDFLAAANKILSKSNISYEQCNKAVDFYKAAYKQNPYHEGLVGKINETISYCKKVKLNEDRIAAEENESKLFNRYTNNAKFFQSSKNYEAALEEFKKALAIRPNSNYVINSIANLEAEIGRQKVAPRTQDGSYIKQTGPISGGNNKAYNKILQQEKSRNNPSEISNENLNQSKLVQLGNQALKEGKLESSLAYYERSQQIKYNEGVAISIRGIKGMLNNQSNSLTEKSIQVYEEDNYSVNSEQISNETNLINNYLRSYYEQELDPTAVALTKTLNSAFSTGNSELDELGTDLGLTIAAAIQANDRRKEAQRKVWAAERKIKKSKEQKKFNERIEKLLKKFDYLNCSELLDLANLCTESEITDNKGELMKMVLNRIYDQCYMSGTDDDKRWLHSKLSYVADNKSDKIINIVKELRYTPEDHYRSIYDRMYDLFLLIDSDNLLDTKLQLTNYYYAKVLPNKKSISGYRFRWIKKKQIKNVEKNINKKTLKNIKKNPSEIMDFSFLNNSYEIVEKEKVVDPFKAIDQINRNIKENLLITASVGYKKDNNKKDVKLVQCLLNQLEGSSPKLLVDGLYGNKSKNAIIRFQKANQLKETGFLIPEGKGFKLLKQKVEDVTICFNDISSNSLYTAYVDWEIPLRSEPSVNSKQIYLCPKGAEVQVLDNSGKQYHKIAINGKTGFISKEYLVMEKK